MESLWEIQLPIWNYLVAFLVNVTLRGNTSRKGLGCPWLLFYLATDFLYDSLTLPMLYHLPYPLRREAQTGCDPVPWKPSRSFSTYCQLNPWNLGNPRQRYFIWLFLLLLLLNEYEEEGDSDSDKTEWPRKGMCQEMTQRKESILALFLSLAVCFLKWLF